MLKSLLFVALGGAAGSVLRYVLSRWTGEQAFPWSTLAVNLIGSLLIGLLVGLSAKGLLSAQARLLLVTGFCGGFTTFSTFANESFSLMRGGDILLAAAYAAVSVFMGIVAVYVGMKLSYC